MQPDVTAIIERLKQQLRNKLGLKQPRDTPIIEQIENLMRILPPYIRDRPWHMADLVNSLHGRYRERPHPQHVGAACRQLGWRRVRIYGGGFDGIRLWFPPGPKR